MLQYGMPPTLRTERTLLRPWCDADRIPFAAMNADPEVMRHFPTTLTRAESDQMIERIEWIFETYGFGLWALEIPHITPFAGFVGLAPVTFPAPFAPAIEIGWRLALRHWNQGLATEAAREVLRFGFAEKNLLEVVSFTISENQKSQRVMEKIGLKLAGHFEHPRLPVGHPMRQHVLYRLNRAEWQSPH